MPSHFSSIGIPVESEEDVRALLEKVADEVEEIPCGEGAYFRWSSEQGAELWLQLDKRGSIVGVTPYYKGKSEMRVGLTAAVKRPDDTPLEGAVHGWADPQGEDPESGNYPFVFDLVDKAVYGKLDFPFVSQVRLSAFAHELSLFESEDAYDASQEGEVRFASESFFPASLFTPDGEATEPPNSHAIFTGRILEARELTNSLTDGRYVWMQVRTLGGEIDVVSDLELIEMTPVEGGIVSGSFWLCGRILEPKIAAKPGLLSRLFR